ncbi:unnamed protein product [Ixodes persulcatus]
MVFWFTTDHFKFLVVPMRGLNGAIEAGASFSLIIHSIGGCRFAVWPSSFPPGPLPACTYACTSSSLSASGCSCPGGACAPIATAPPFSPPPPQHCFPSRAFSISWASFHARQGRWCPGPCSERPYCCGTGTLPPSARPVRCARIKNGAVLLV